MNTIIGIDLGTTYSCVGVWKDGKPEIIPNDQGNRTTPSFVSFTHTDRLVGDAAKNVFCKNPENTVFDAKRLIGKNFSDPCVQSDCKNWPFKVVEGKNDKVFIEVSYKGRQSRFLPEEISSLILTKMKNIAKAYLGGAPVSRAVITVPAYFNDSQRRATKMAGEIAGLEVVRIINEPTAAALAYGLDTNKEMHNILVFDLGGGTFDVSTLTIEDQIFEVRSTAGNTHLGGEDFDNRLVDHFVELFKTQHQANLRDSPRAITRLRNECEKAKRILSTAFSAQIEIESLMNGIDFYTTISRAKFEELCDDLFHQTLDSVQSVLKDANLEKSDINEIVMVGGSTRIPKVRSLLSDFFGGKELNFSVNPDEAVAYGATVQASILSGIVSSSTEAMLLLDVTPLTLGVDTIGGVMTSVVQRNTRIPLTKSREFTTSHDNQTAISFPIQEGERPLTKDNRVMGVFSLSGIRPALRGVVKVNVTFAIDANGILKVTAHDAATGNTQSIVITNNSNRPDEHEINQMKKEAEKFEQEDEMMRQKIAKRQSLVKYALTVINCLHGESCEDGGAINGGVINADDMLKENVCRLCREAIEWAENCEIASAEDYANNQKNLESLCEPILQNNFY